MVQAEYITSFEWAMLSIAALGAVLTAGTIVGGAVWAVGRIRTETVSHINAERQITDARLETERQIVDKRLDADRQLLMDHAADFDASQQTQDDRVAETVRALRSYIETVEKSMRTAELWNRDNFVLKNDFVKATDEIKDVLRLFAQDIKADIRALTMKVDHTHVEH